MQEKIGIIGFGDIGRRVAQLYQQTRVNTATSTAVSLSSTDILTHPMPSASNQSESNQEVDLLGLACSSESIAQGQQMGLTMLQCDLDQALPETTLFDQRALFYFVPPPNPSQHKDNTDPRLQALLAHLGDRPSKVVLISTTGVYGDSQGAWIDESTPLRPQADRAKRRLAAEQAVQAWGNQWCKPYIILRVPGIYAPDRLPLARLKKGLPIVHEREAPWTNRIHADDLAYICQTAMQSSLYQQIYNVTDGQPSTMTDYFNQVADAVGLARPPQISLTEAKQTLSAGMVSYLQESRRIRNDKMCHELNITLAYPNLKAGLASLSST
ncbi:MAG: SDR family oxidoreductase [bacterium]